MVVPQLVCRFTTRGTNGARVSPCGGSSSVMTIRSAKYRETEAAKDTINIFREQEKLFQGKLFRFFRATVTGTSGSLVTIQRPGQASPDPESYPRLASYSAPAAPDEVLVMELGGSCLVIGKIVR